MLRLSSYKSALTIASNIPCRLYSLFNSYLLSILFLSSAQQLERDGSAFTSTLYVPSLTPVVADCAVLTIEIFTRLCHNAFLPGQQVLLRSLPDAGESTSNLLSIIVETISSIQSRLSTYWLSYICNKKATLQPYQAGFYHYYSVACTHLVTSVTAGFLKRSQDLIAKNVRLLF